MNYSKINTTLIAALEDQNKPSFNVFVMTDGTYNKLIDQVGLKGTGKIFTGTLTRDNIALLTKEDWVVRISNSGVSKPA